MQTSNEELAIRAKDGDQDALLLLWDQVLPLISTLASRRQATHHNPGVDVDDLVQSGFFAVLEAIQAFDPEKEYRFTTYVGNCLKTAFAECCGHRTQLQAQDPVRSAVSLDAPVDGAEDLILADSIPDPVDHIEALENHLYNQQLRRILDEALGRLPAAEAAVLKERYFRAQTVDVIASRSGLTREEIRKHERHGLRELRQTAYRSGLRQFVDDMSDFYHGSAEDVTIRREILRHRYQYDHI